MNAPMTPAEAVSRMDSAAEVAALEIGAQLGRTLTQNERLIIKLAFSKGANHGADAMGAMWHEELSRVLRK